ncbi:hypothetical protein [Anaerostipes sp.]|uniref:hypothetical protein n=1 Tax=Anaerostipes sp. TaxID=1872530 RepID=UPI0025C6524F|nr:hypothetical protein [Anaerostipes sp.]MBS7007564.1 hypothetical protein [Anaerostipes sp.]
MGYSENLTNKEINDYIEYQYFDYLACQQSKNFERSNVIRSHAINVLIFSANIGAITLEEYTSLSMLFK